jgi:hypothetical protein
MTGRFSFAVTLLCGFVVLGALLPLAWLLAGILALESRLSRQLKRECGGTDWIQTIV